MNRIVDRAKAAPYLRSIVLNLARDHNRRGLVSLRHHSTSIRSTSIGAQRADDASTPDLIVNHSTFLETNLPR